MNIADLGLGLHLCRQAGWNQIESDWRRFLEMQPEGCFVAELDGAPVGTTVTCLFGKVAWIAMVLVEIGARRQGVATALLQHALDFLDEQGMKTVRLDATAAGQPVYKKLGFTPEYRLTRYQGIAPQVGGPSAATDTAGDLLAEIVALDRRTTDTPREKMLARLLAESPETGRVLRRAGQLEGFIVARRGANATQIGPCIATSDAGSVLLNDALRRCAGRAVFLDVPCDNTQALAVVEANGLTAQRHFTRMYRGDQLNDCVEAIWASSGPEKG
jgi:ribosomal protein S18 acetylase RimI-like enzyme